MTTIAEQISQDGRSDRTLLEAVIHSLAILWSRRRTITIVTIVTAAFAVALSILSLALPPDHSFLPDIYRADSVLIVQPSQGGGLNAVLQALGLPNDAQATGSSSAAAQSLDYGQLALTVLRSRTLLDKLVDEFDIGARYHLSGKKRARTRKALASRMKITYTKSDNITSTGGLLTIAFDSIDPVFARDVVNRTVELLNQFFISQGGNTRLEQKQLLETKLAEVSGEISRLEADIQAFQKKYGVLTVQEIADQQSKVLADLRSQLVLKEMEIKNRAQFSRIRDPELVALQAQYDNIAALIAQNEKQFAGLDLPTLSLEFNRMKASLDIQQRIFQTLSEQYEITKLTLESQPVFTVLEPAEVPDEKAGPSRGKLCALAVLLAIVASSVVILAGHSLRARKPEDGAA